jgi:hypothetical protein
MLELKSLKTSLLVLFIKNDKGGWIEWIQDYNNAFTKIVLLGQKTWKDENFLC